MLIHGEKTRTYQSPEHIAWRNMIARCYNPNYNRFNDWGGRGIKVCKRWRKSFVYFLEDVGRKPSKNHSIERINLNGDYEPGNVRWATSKEQARNQRRNIFVTFNGITLCLKDWAIKRGLKYTTVHSRIRRGSSPEKALGME